ncbi:MAG: CoA transferase [Acidobacteriota bacterium]|nr:CoA transferase [Acidobacteriota bacterium]
MIAPTEALDDVWRLGGGDRACLERVRLIGTEPVLPSIYRVGTAAAATTAASGLAAAELWHRRGGRRQEVRVDLRAAALAFRAEHYLRVDDGPPPRSWDELAGYYQTGDDRWIQLHTNFPHHKAGVLEVLGCEASRDAVRAALLEWDGPGIDAALGERGLCAALMRSSEEWSRHPHAAELATLPLFEIERIGDADPEPLPPAERPLGDVRVLDLTRVIAGPVCGRELASHGATVMRVSGPHLPSMAPLVIESGRGKLAAFVDLREESGRQRLRELASTADVFVQGYRPGAIAEHGFSAADLATLRPGIVYVSLSAYGRKGPWSARRGFDSLVQIATGIAHSGAAAAGVDRPRPLPCQALDHGSGFLCAFGAMMGLLKRCEEGGSWHVRVSLAQTGRWIENLGRIDGLGAADPPLEEVGDVLDTLDSPFGKITYVRSPVGLEETPPHWVRPPVALGSHPPEWPPR